MDGARLFKWRAGYARHHRIALHLRLRQVASDDGFLQFLHTDRVRHLDVG